MQWIHAWMNLRYNIEPLVVLMSTRTFFIFCLNLENFVFDVSWEKEKSFDVLCMYITQWMWFVYYKKPLIQKTQRMKTFGFLFWQRCKSLLALQKTIKPKFLRNWNNSCCSNTTNRFFEKVIQNTSILKLFFLEFILFD